MQRTTRKNSGKHCRNIAIMFKQQGYTEEVEIDDHTQFTRAPLINFNNSIMLCYIPEFTRMTAKLYGQSEVTVLYSKK